MRGKTQSASFPRWLWDLTLHLVSRDLRLRYRRSLLGYAWALVLPAAQALVLIVVFQRIIPLDIEAFPAFLLAGLLPWTWFSSSLTAVCGTFHENREMFRQPGFHPPLLVVSSVVSNLIVFVYSLPILLLVLALYGRFPGPSSLLLPVLLVLQSLLVVGLGVVLATLNVEYSDIGYLVSVALNLLFYLTPVFYAPPSRETTFGLAYFANPVAGLIDSYRAILFEGTVPSAYPMAVLSLAAALSCLLAWWVWRRRESDVRDLV